MGPALLEVVIVSSTGAREVLRPCLLSLRETPPAAGPMAVHVVDNASTDGTPEMVRDEFPEVELHALDWNSGFCVANNIVLRRSRAPLVLVLNPDTEVYDGALDHMIDSRPIPSDTTARRRRRPPGHRQLRGGGRAVQRVGQGFAGGRGGPGPCTAPNAPRRSRPERATAVMAVI